MRARALDHRMADKGRLQADISRRTALRTETAPAPGRNSAPSPWRDRRATGPDLRRDIIDGADGGIALLDAARDAMGEIGTVDHHHRIGLGLQPRNPPPACTRAQDGGNGRHHFAQAHHRGGVQRKKTLQPFARHRRAAHAGDADAVAGQLPSGPPSVARPAGRRTARRRPASEFLTRLRVTA